jgi:hypothetical protein
MCVGSGAGAWRRFGAQEKACSLCAPIPAASPASPLAVGGLPQVELLAMLTIAFEYARETRRRRFPGNEGSSRL